MTPDFSAKIPAEPGQHDGRRQPRRRRRGARREDDSGEVAGDRAGQQQSQQAQQTEHRRGAPQPATARSRIRSDRRGSESARPRAGYASVSPPSTAAAASSAGPVPPDPLVSGPLGPREPRPAYRPIIRKNSGMATNKMIRPRNTPTSSVGTSCAKPDLKAPPFQDSEQERRRQHAEWVVAGEDRDGDPVESERRDRRHPPPLRHQHPHRTADAADRTRERHRPDSRRLRVHAAAVLGGGRLHPAGTQVVAERRVLDEVVEPGDEADPDHQRRQQREVARLREEPRKEGTVRTRGRTRWRRPRSPRRGIPPTRARTRRSRR